MITVNMHEAKTRLSQLVKAVVEDGETVILQRNGVAVAELIPVRKTARFRRLKIDRRLKPIAVNYDPAEPLQPDEWPEDLR